MNMDVVVGMSVVMTVLLLHYRPASNLFLVHGLMCFDVVVYMTVMVAVFLLHIRYMKMLFLVYGYM